MELGRYLSAANLNEFLQSYREFLLTLKNNSCYDSTSIDDMIAEIPVVNWYHLPRTIKTDIFDKIEFLFSYTDAEVDWINLYSKEQFEYASNNGMLYPHVKRWYDWLNYNLSVVSGQEPKYQYLCCRNENEAFEQLYDINGEPIISNEGYF